MAQVAEQIQELLNRVVALEVATHPTVEDYSDPPLYLTYADGTSVNPDTIEDIPDLVKGLPNFNGDPNELSFFIQDADSIVKLYAPNGRSTIDDRNKFHVVCKSIRRKIKGEANDALVASNVNINWNMIKKTLSTYYGEKRDLETLDFQLMSSQQKGKSLEDYYDEINKLLSLIANTIRTDERFSHPEATKAMIYTYNKKAIDAFIRGLDGDVGRFLKNAEPESLAHAYSYCITFQNIEFRKGITGQNSFANTISNKPRNLIPSLPPKPAPRGITHINQPILPIRNQILTQPNYFRQQIQKPPIPPRKFIPVGSWNQPNPDNGRWMHGHGQQNYPPHPPRIPPPPPRNPFQQNRPEPMEVDRSIQTKQVNYGNRPYQPSNKRPRLFNILPPENTTQEDYPDQEEETMVRQTEDIEQYEEMYNESLNDTPYEKTYFRQTSNQNDETQQFNEEFNFLE